MPETWNTDTITENFTVEKKNTEKSLTNGVATDKLRLEVSVCVDLFDERYGMCMSAEHIRNIWRVTCIASTFKENWPV